VSEQEREILSTCSRGYQRVEVIHARLVRRWPLLTCREIDASIASLVDAGKLITKSIGPHRKYMRA